MGCPIRRSRDQRSLASPPGFSQRATSFIASQCQGIHQMPFSLRLIPGVFSRRRRDTAAHRGKTPIHQAASHEDTSRIDPTQAHTCAARPTRLGHMTNSLFTLQSTRYAPGDPGRCRFLLQTPLMEVPNWWRCPKLVEVNGIEPMTSCLQSRRSPN